VALGVPDGMIGTAWPSMRQSIGAPIGDLGLILLAATAGSAVVSAFVSALIRRLGVPALLAMAASCGALGAAGFALAPGLWLLIGVAVLAGACAGMLDSTAVIWLQPGAAATVGGFVVLGGALAGLFPALVALTPGRIGQQRAHRVIGWQMGAAAVGGAGLSAVIGWLISLTSLAVLGPALTVLALLLVATEVTLARLAATEPTAVTPSG